MMKDGKDIGDNIERILRWFFEAGEPDLVVPDLDGSSASYLQSRIALMETLVNDAGL
jgi:hypothetical protein